MPRLPRPVNLPLRRWRRSPSRGNRISMYRIILFLVLIALAAAGAAWIADQTGDVVLSSGGWRVETSLPVFALALGVIVVAAMLAWSILRGLWRTPQRIKRARRERRHARGRHAITHGLLAIGHGDSVAARLHADVARRHATHDPLALLLHAQSAQLDGDREGARAAFRAMAERGDTRLLGLRGLFIEAQRADDPVAAVMIAEEALKLAPASTWASHAVLGFRCAKADWSAALSILDNNLASGLIDKAAYRRQRGVLLTARALELETVDRDLSRESVMEAVKLAPTLVPAAVLDLARGARAERSGLDRGRICLGSLAAGIAGDRPSRRLSVAAAAGGIALRQECGDRSRGIQCRDLGATPRRAAA